MPRAWAVILDFDGTLTRRDVADRILSTFGGLRREDLAQSHRKGVVTEDWVYEKYRRIKTPRRRIAAWGLRQAQKRSGIEALAAFCRAGRIPIEVVSGGLDLYVDPLLKRWGLGRVPRFRASSRDSSKGLWMRYLFLKNSRTLGDFKASRVRAMKRRGRRVLYAGDGPSDLRAARAADLVFARGELARLLKKQRRPFRVLRDFRGVLAQLKKTSR